MKSIKSILISMLLCVGAVANADASSHYFDPDAQGHGVSVTKDSGQGSAFTWYLYDRQGNPTWLISTSNCTEYPCDIKLATSAGTWMGGEFELVEVGSVNVDFIDGNLFWEYDVQAWPEAGDCGRLVWVFETQCVGKFEFTPVD